MQVGMKLRTKCVLSLQLSSNSTGTVNNIFATNIVNLTLTKTGNFLNRIQENWKTEHASGVEDNLH